MSLNRKIIISIALTANSAPGFAEESNTTLQPVEIHVDPVELKNIRSKLRNINRTLHALPRTVTEAGLGAQTIDAKKALERAEDGFKSGNWNAAVNESGLFLNLTQRPDPATSMRVQFILGRAYEERRQYLKSTRAYSRYLAIFTTNQELAAPELTEVFERLIKISTKNAQLKSPELSRFLSTVVAIERPQHLKDELKYLSAVAGANIGKKAPAIQWLGQVDRSHTGPDTRARAKYFRALLAINEKNWQNAANELESITRLEGISDKLRDNANLSLARVQIKLKKPNMALASYSQIKESSLSHRDASYETIFLLINEEKHQDAKQLAKKWLAENPNDPDALQIRTISSWLDLKAGDLDGAKTSIEETSSLLASIQRSLKTEFQSPTLTLADGERLAALTSGQAPPSAELDKIIVTFKQLSELKQRLLEIDGAERNIIYSLAKGDLGKYRPALTNQISQYESLADNILKLGIELVAIERARLQRDISQLHIQQLESNAAKRENIFSHYEELRRQLGRWENWFITAEQSSRLAKDWQRIGDLDARQSASSMQTQKSEDNEQLTKSISSARLDMLKTLRHIQESQVKNLAKQSEIRDLTAIVDNFSKLIYQDYLILSSYQPETGSALDRFDSEDAGNAWSSWLDTANLLYENLQKTETNASEALAKVISDLERVDETKTAILTEIKSLTSELEKIGGDRLPKILAEFDYSISQRAGRQIKWAGDLEFLRYIETSNERERARRKHALELQILSDDVHDSGQRRSK